MFELKPTGLIIDDFFYFKNPRRLTPAPIENACFFRSLKVLRLPNPFLVKRYSQSLGCEEFCLENFCRLKVLRLPQNSNFYLAG
jgi:hypothetical protein